MMTSHMSREHTRIQGNILISGVEITECVIPRPLIDFEH